MPINWTLFDYHLTLLTPGFPESILFAMKVAHLSDLHFGNPVCPQKKQALLSDLQIQEPDLIVVSGDITDRGKRKQFKQAKDFLDSTNCEYLSVPGNRETPVLAPWELLIPPFSMRRYRSFFGPSDKVFYKSEKHGTVLIGLNSVSQFPSWPGSISRASRYWFREQIEKHESYCKILFLHHPVLPVLRASSFWAHQLSDAGAILTLCAQFKVRLILQGHKHRSSVVELRIPDSKSSIVVSSSGSPLLEHGDNIYHVIRVRERMIEIETREFVQREFSTKMIYEFDNF